jgi:hypothetical protein
LVAYGEEIRPVMAGGFGRKNYLTGHRIPTDVNRIGLVEPEFGRQAYLLGE